MNVRIVGIRYGEQNRDFGFGHYGDNKGSKVSIENALPTCTSCR
jgi:hypothetical protein